MNRLLYFVFHVLFLSACSPDVVNDDVEPTDDTGTEITPNKADAVEPTEGSEDITYHFKSDGEGVVEYMRCTVMPDGSHAWIYYTLKNEKHIELGTREEAGFEVVYFLGKPKELYWIYGSECGFTLSDDTRKTSQWYGQVTPRCADDMF